MSDFPGPELARELEALGCQALLVVAGSSRDPDLAPFVGPVHLHAAFVIATAKRAPLLGYMTPMERDEAAASGLELLTPEMLDVSRWARDGAPPETVLANSLEQGLAWAGLAPGRVALAGHAAVGDVWAACQQLAGDGWRFVTAHRAVRRLRRRKGELAVAEVKRVSAAVTETFRHVAAALAASEARSGELWLENARLTVGALRRLVAERLARHGLEQPEGNIVAPGEQGGVPHTAGDDARVLRPGESIVVDLYPRGHLFTDCTRTFCLGAAPEALAAAHETVLRALRLAHQRARPGSSGWDAQEAVCELVTAAGYPTPISAPGTTRGYVHGLGHGVGHELHELPSFRETAGDDGVLAAGDVFTLEPGIYEPEAGLGVRLEDLVHLGEDGPELLTPLPYDLDPRRW